MYSFLIKYINFRSSNKNYKRYQIWDGTSRFQNFGLICFEKRASHMHWNIDQSMSHEEAHASAIMGTQSRYLLKTLGTSPKTLISRAVSAWLLKAYNSCRILEELTLNKPFYCVQFLYNSNFELAIYFLVAG